ncbi:glycosyltransferase family protein [Ferruginibacter profundus]
MNLLLVNSIDFPYGGAQCAYVTLMMKGFKENGVNAFLVIPYGLKKEVLSGAENKYGHFDGVPYYFVKDSRDIKKGFRFLDNFLGVIKTACLIRKRWKAKKLDAVMLGGIVDILRDGPIILVCALWRIPIYFWLVEKASLNEDFQGIPGYCNYKSQQLTERFLPKFAAGLIVISSALKKHYLKYLPENKILISPIYVAEQINKRTGTASFKAAKENLAALYAGKRLLVYSGTFAEKDGLFYLIEAFAETVKKYPDTIFIMTGKSANVTLMDRVRDHIKKYNLEDKVKMVGFVNADELLCYNTMADALFVCRSNSPFANHGFPWKLGEYCMTAKPIIATRVGDIDKYFTDNETLFIVEPNNPGAIAKKIDYIFDHYEQSLTVAKNGRAVALREFGYLEKSKEVADFIDANKRK